MPTPFSTPGLPSAPHPSPDTGVAYTPNFTLARSKPLKPPIYNPYDKFTQPEFDAWIGGITGALRRALGQDQEDLQYATEGDERASSAYDFEDAPRDSDDEVEDSFAEMRARHVKGKGKARDPREGPGLGGQDTPIEIQSDSGEEGEEEWEDEGEGEEKTEEHTFDYDWNEREEPSQAAGDFDVSADEAEDGGEREEGEVEELGRESPEEVIELVSDDEETEAKDATGLEWVEGEELEEGGYSDDEGGQDHHTSDLFAGRDQRFRLTTAKFPQPHHEVIGGDDGDAEETDEIDDDQAQPEDDEDALSAFPPRPFSQSHSLTRPIELPDPWKGPEMYAEDYYSGGNFLRAPGAHLTADRLGESDDGDIGMFLTPGVVTPTELVDEEESYPEQVQDEAEKEIRERHALIDIDFPEDDLVNDEDERHGRDERVQEEEDILPGSSPLTSSPLEEAHPLLPSDRDAHRNNEILDIDDLYSDMEFEHENQQTDGVPMHLDWNYPPAFKGAVTSGPGHLATPEESGQEGCAGSDEDEEVGGFGALPLGTSDLGVNRGEVDLDEGERDEGDSVTGKGDAEVLDNIVPIANNAQGDAGNSESINAETTSEVVAQETSPEPEIQVSAPPHPEPDAQLSAQAPETDFGLLPTPPNEFDSILAHALPGEQEMADILTSLVQSESESESQLQSGNQPAVNVEAEVDMPVMVDAVYTVIEAGSEGGDDDDAAGAIDIDISVLSVPEDYRGEVVYTVEEPLTETEGRLTDELEQPEIRATVVSLDEDKPLKEALTDNAHLDAADYTVEVTEGPQADSAHSEVQEGDVFSISASRNDVEPDILPSDGDVSMQDTLKEPPADSGVQQGTTVTEHEGETSSPTSRINESPVHNSIPMPVSADPSVPDLISPSHGPLILSMPGTPTFLLSPAGTPGSGRPTPVSVPVPASILKALQLQQPLSGSTMSTSGLFTPGAPSPSGAVTPEDTSGQAQMVELMKEAESRAEEMDVEAERHRNPEEVHQPKDGDSTPIAVAGAPTAQSEIDIAGDLSERLMGQVSQQDKELADDEKISLVSLAVVSDTSRSHPNYDLPEQPKGEALHQSKESSNSQQTKVDPHVSKFEPTEPAGTSSILTAEPMPPIKPNPKPSLLHRTPAAQFSTRVILTRKPTDPILYADPYPYSLSTPGSEFLHSKEIHDEPSEEEHDEHDLSISSTSTFEKELEDKHGRTHLGTSSDDNAEETLEDLELRYPSEAEAESKTDIQHLTAIKGTGVITKAPLGQENVGGEDKDADGEMDPDFIEAGVILPSQTSQQPEVDIQTETDPFKLMGTDSTVAPGPVDDSGGSNYDKDVEEENTTGQLSNGDISQPKTQSSDGHNVVVDIEPSHVSYELVNKHLTAVSKVPMGSSKKFDDEEVSIVETNGADKSSSTSMPKPSSRPSKRKRTSPLRVHSRLTRSMSSKTLENHGASSDYSQKGKGKGKGKEKEVPSPSEKGSDASGDSWSTSSGASTASRMLHPGSTHTSRASSIVSSVSDKSSLMTQPSPTMKRHGSNPQLPPPPFFHTHSHSHAIPHHHHPPPFLTAQQQLHHQIPKSLSISRPKGTAAAGPSSPQPVPSQRAAPLSSSPVTRSNCRFHKISLPREEGGPRVCFLVPGCSLGDRDLMVEEEIEDHGDATIEDSTRMVPDIESLDFSSYLIGILRQLVGVDLLREQEVYYLPQPGEERVRNARRKSIVEKSALNRLSTRDSETGSTIGSPHTSIGSVRSPTSSRAPVSAAGSTSTTMEPILRKGRGSEPDSFSGISFSESELSEVDDSPKSKRGRPSSLEENDETSELVVPDSGVGSPNHRLKSRRSKRLGKDAAAYKPETEVDGESPDEDHQKTPKTRRKFAKRGVKRTRTSDATGGNEDPERQRSKRQRLRPNESQEQA